MGGRKRYVGLLDRAAWIGVTLVPMHRALMEAQLKCFPYHDEYLAIDKALEGLRICASELVGIESPFKAGSAPTAYAQSTDEPKKR